LPAFRRAAALAATCVSACLCGPATASAEAGMEATLAEISGPGWRAADVSVSLVLASEGRLDARFSAIRLELPPPLGVRKGVTGSCRGLLITPLRVACDELALAFPGNDGVPLRIRGRLEYRRDTGALHASLEIPGLRPGALRLEGRVEDEAWVMQLAAEALSPGQLAPVAALLGIELPPLEGTLDLAATARGRTDSIHGAVFELVAESLAGSNASGTLATEGLGLELRGSAWPADGEGLMFEIRGAAPVGEVYVEPVYGRLDDHPVTFTARGQFSSETLRLDRLSIAQEGAVLAAASATVAGDGEGQWSLRAARLEIAEATLPGAYEIYLKPFLAGTPLGALDTAGRLTGEAELNGAELARLRVQLDNLHIDDREARLAVFGLSGELAWNAALPAAEPQRLRWSGGFLYGIPFGLADFLLEPRDGRWALAGPSSIPVLDGAIEIERLELGDFLAGDEAILFDARLAPVSLRELSRALNWPPLSGQLAGTLPSLGYEDEVLRVAGEFRAEAFGGVVSVRELQVERPLQPRARLVAEIELEGLELARLTEILSFGLMTGRLDGYVHGLELIDWVPVAFDARLYTPAGERGRRRISQRAVDNIASLGGGGAGVLSTGFLRFFESFAYDAFALGCRLERDVCAMSGLEARDQGYVILRGRGLPRIDVIGFADRVSWSTLVEQLKGIMESGEVEIR
jgi:hypothetical protein